MKVVPLAFESFGVRSMSTFIRAGETSIIIDPGVALAPRRYGLPPHPKELKAKMERWKTVKSHAEQADIIIITHYHFDHYNPFEDLQIYEGKTLLTKHPTDHINYSQKKRAYVFLKNIKGKPEKITYADGGTFKFSGVTVRFSDPVYHGANPRLGYVNMVSVDGGEKLLHTSDVEGPTQQDQLQFILDEKPDILIVDGPMTYMLGYRFSEEHLKLSLSNLITIIEKTPVRTIIIEHHTLRELNWASHVEPFILAAKEAGVRVETAAEYAGEKTNLLEAKRKQLYDEEPVSREKLNIL